METLAGNYIQLVLPWPVRIPDRAGISFTLRFRIRFDLYLVIRDYKFTRIIHLLASKFYSIPDKSIEFHG